MTKFLHRAVLAYFDCVPFSFFFPSTLAKGEATVTPPFPNPHAGHRRLSALSCTKDVLLPKFLVPSLRRRGGLAGSACIVKAPDRQYLLLALAYSSRCPPRSSSLPAPAPLSLPAIEVHHVTFFPRRETGVSLWGASLWASPIFLVSEVLRRFFFSVRTSSWRSRSHTSKPIKI